MKVFHIFKEFVTDNTRKFVKRVKGEFENVSEPEGYPRGSRVEGLVAVVELEHVLESVLTMSAFINYTEVCFGIFSGAERSVFCEVVELVDHSLEI
eukprot:CAMPEP_0205831822 /NCGR_PEP_ID=MMETSP0206-20130828/45241_1 /ASSEMBLY_ACC=CAM_ASM_000279 /TAXON_ID=36767 /ORGANISM="Euplotes focardii, Strain TN1" /LENGTH=95 /DNA_ID=CAMNT_0053136817 /DNA_START=976 /DNA_END=1263 /DNA_ORIENTATION=+